MKVKLFIYNNTLICDGNFFATNNTISVDQFINNQFVYNGVASYNYTVDKIGNFTILAFYEGSSNFNPSNVSSTLSVDKAQIIMVLDNISAFQDRINITVHIISNFSINSGMLVFLLMVRN